MSTNTAANVQSPPTTSRWKGSTVRSLFVRRRLRDLIVKNIDKIEELFAFSTGKYIEPNTGYKRTLFNKTRKQAVTEDKKPLSTLFRLISQLIPSKKVDTGLKEQIENTNQGDSIWAKIKSGKVDEVSFYAINIIVKVQFSTDLYILTSHYL